MNPQTRRQVLRTLQKPYIALRLLATSRNIPEIGSELPEHQEIVITAHKRDLRTLVRARLHEQGTETFHETILRQPSNSPSFATIEEEIFSKVIDSAKNMYVSTRCHPGFPISVRITYGLRFLLASLQLDRILECSRVEDVNHHLMNPPLEVNAIYDQAWDRATGDKDSRKSQRARLILMWVTCAKTGITVKALGQALSFSGHGMDNAPFTAAEIVSSCAGLVRVEPMEPSSSLPRDHVDIESVPRATKEYTERELQNSSVVAPIHLSARRYLETKRESLFPHADCAMIATCLNSTGSNGLISAAPRIYFILVE